MARYTSINGILLPLKMEHFGSLKRPVVHFLFNACQVAGFKIAPYFLMSLFPFLFLECVL